MNITYTHADAQDLYQHSSKVTSKKIPETSEKNETPYLFFGMGLLLRGPWERSTYPLFKGTLRVVHGSHGRWK